MIKDLLRKNPIGKEILTRAYRVRRQVSADIHRTVEKLITPDDDMIVFSLVMNTANMALERGKYVEFAPVSGMVGVCKLSGNSLPVFEYKVFHAQPVMEFIKVRVEVARPDRISFTAHIESAGTVDDKDHGKEMEIIEAYRKPFFTLAHHLYNYFPHSRDPVCRAFPDVEKLLKNHIQEHRDYIEAEARLSNGTLQ
jgi:hypothetical protein